MFVMELAVSWAQNERLIKNHLSLSYRGGVGALLWYFERNSGKKRGNLERKR